MTGPIEVDATVKAMVELINRVARDTAFRQLCESDMAAALAELGSAPAEGVTFDYLHDADGHRLRVERGGEVTTCVLTADGELRLDSGAFGEVAQPGDELDDVALAAVAGGGCGGGDFDCLAVLSCYGWSQPGIGIRDGCTSVPTPAVCMAWRWGTGETKFVPCQSK